MSASQASCRPTRFLRPDRAPRHWRKKRPAVADSNHIQDDRRRSRCFRTSSFLPACRQVSFAHPKRMGRRFPAFYLETPRPENKRLGRSPRRSHPGLRPFRIPDSDLSASRTLPLQHPGLRPCSIPNSALAASRTLPAIVQRSRQSNPRSTHPQCRLSQADRVFSSRPCFLKQTGIAQRRKHTYDEAGQPVVSREPSPSSERRGPRQGSARVSRMLSGPEARTGS